MSDTPKIAPALTPDEWKVWFRTNHALPRLREWWRGPEKMGLSEPAQAIALGNDALDDDDQRKITRAGVTAMRDDAAKLRARSLNGDDDLFLIAWRLSLLADALESYLPPES